MWKIFFFVMINCEDNRRLFHRDLLVNISFFMRIFALHLIIQEIQVIPLVCSDTPDLIISTPNVFPNYIINNGIEGNKYGVTILNNIPLGIHRTQEMQKKLQENNRLSKTT